MHRRAAVVLKLMHPGELDPEKAERLNEQIDPRESSPVTVSRLKDQKKQGFVLFFCTMDMSHVR